VIRRLLLVGLVPLLIGGIAGTAAGFAFGPEQWTFAAIAFGLCVPPGIVVVRLHDWLVKSSPFGRVVALFTGTFIRLVTGFGGGVGIFLVLSLEDRNAKLAYWGWILFAYLTTLATETVVFAKPTAEKRSSDGQ
jgi:hypothetical protein